MPGETLWAPPITFVHATGDLETGAKSHVGSELRLSILETVVAAQGAASLGTAARVERHSIDSGDGNGAGKLSSNGRSNYRGAKVR